MLTRRWFGGCAVCAAIEGLAASAAAQSPPTSTVSGLASRVVDRAQGPGPYLITMQIEFLVEPSYVIEFHTHPGVESTFVAEGTGTLKVRDQADHRLLPGDSFIIPVRVPHGFANGPSRTRLYSTFVVDGTQPLSSPSRE